jgi:hypothetical protein
VVDILPPIISIPIASISDFNPTGYPDPQDCFIAKQ